MKYEKETVRGSIMNVGVVEYRMMNEHESYLIEFLVFVPVLL